MKFVKLMLMGRVYKQKRLAKQKKKISNQRKLNSYNYTNQKKVFIPK